MSRCSAVPFKNAWWVYIFIYKYIWLPCSKFGYCTFVSMQFVLFTIKKTHIVQLINACVCVWGGLGTFADFVSGKFTGFVLNVLNSGKVEITRDATILFIEELHCLPCNVYHSFNHMNIVQIQRHKKILTDHMLHELPSICENHIDQ